MRGPGTTNPDAKDPRSNGGGICMTRPRHNFLVKGKLFQRTSCAKFMVYLGWLSVGQIFTVHRVSLLDL